MKACFFLLLTINWCTTKSYKMSVEAGGAGLEGFIKFRSDLDVGDGKDEEEEVIVIPVSPSNLGAAEKAKIDEYFTGDNQHAPVTYMLVMYKGQDPTNLGEILEVARARDGIDITDYDATVLVRNNQIDKVDFDAPGDDKDVKAERVEGEEFTATAAYDGDSKSVIVKMQNRELEIDAEAVEGGERIKKIRVV